MHFQYTHVGRRPFLNTADVQAYQRFPDHPLAKILTPVVVERDVVAVHGQDEDELLLLLRLSFCLCLLLDSLLLLI